MSEKFSKQIFCGLCSRGDYRQVAAYLNRVVGGKRLAAKLKRIFEDGEYVLKSNNPEVAEFLRVYEDYLKWALANDVTTQQCKEYLLDKFSHMLPDVTDYSDLENKVKDFLEKRGYFALVGITASYPNLYLWKCQTVRNVAVELPSGTINIAACSMRSFISRGWLSYLSLNKTGDAGWATSTSVNYLAFDYFLFSPHLKSLLKHEAQHLYDLRHYPDMKSADLEYRAKLVELIYYKNPMPMLHRHILGMMGNEDGNDRKTNPHGNANRRIAQALSRRLFDKEIETNRELWKRQKKKISTIAKELLDESTKGAAKWDISKTCAQL